MISVIEIPAWLILLKDWLEILGFFSVVVLALFKPVRTVIINFFQKSVKDPDNENREKIEKISNRQKLLEQGMKAILGSHIHEKSQTYIKNGSITPSQMEDMNTLYTSYKSLDGNGTVKKLFTECEKLPTRTNE